MSSLRKNQAYRLQGKQAGGRMTGRRDLACQAHLGPDARIAFDELHSTGDLAADPGLIGDLALQGCDALDDRGVTAVEALADLSLIHI